MGSCSARFEINPFFFSAAPTTSFPSRRPASTSKKSSKKRALVWGFVGGSWVMLLVGVTVFAKRRKFRAAAFGRPIRLEGREMEEDSLIGEDRLTIFNLETLKNATGDFHNDNKLGEGGFGAVYKGTLIDGKEIAVKKLYLKSVQGKQEFLNEVKLVKLQHKNLVHIFGFCAEGSERMLVYEYLLNNSLDKLLFVMAPKYALRGQLTIKADVYSFGVLLLEIVCGRKNTNFKLTPANQILLEPVWRSFERRHGVDVIDRRIVEECGCIIDKAFLMG